MGDNLIHDGGRKVNKIAFLAVILIVLTSSLFIMPVSRKTLLPLNYDPLLETIAKGESQGNYNAYFGNVANQNPVFTEMKVAEVLQWQKKYVESGSRSSAVGKYQFIRPTLNRLVEQLDISKNVRFDEKLQDKLAVSLLERRGLNEYAEGKINRKQFAHNLSKEWAALPKTIGDNPSESYYEGDGLNHVQVSVDEIYDGIDSLQKKDSGPPIQALFYGGE
jgi:muramidase (phage lysozyme)